jgi:hypothetical protein
VTFVSFLGIVIHLQLVISIIALLEKELICIGKAGLVMMNCATQERMCQVFLDWLEPNLYIQLQNIAQLVKICDLLRAILFCRTSAENHEPI